MKIHHFMPGTFEYIGTSDAMPDQADEGRFLVPAYATTKKLPPLKAGQKAYYLREQAKWEARTPPAPVPEPEVVITDEQRIAALRGEANAYVDKVAQKLGFDNISEAVGYADEPAVPLYQAQGRALRAWRSLFWFKFDAMASAMKEDPASIPAGLISIAHLLPEFQPPVVS